MDYLTDLDPQSRTLFCLRTTEGDQSPTLHLQPGDTLDLTLSNRVPALPPGSPSEVISDPSSGRGSNQGNTQNEKSLYHQLSIDFRCYLGMALFEPRQKF